MGTSNHRDRLTFCLFEPTQGVKTAEDEKDMDSDRNIANENANMCIKENCCRSIYMVRNYLPHCQRKRPILLCLRPETRHSGH